MKKIQWNKSDNICGGGFNLIGRKLLGGSSRCDFS